MGHPRTAGIYLRGSAAWTTTLWVRLPASTYRHTNTTAGPRPKGSRQSGTRNRNRLLTLPPESSSRETGVYVLRKGWANNLVNCNVRPTLALQSYPRTRWPSPAPPERRRPPFYTRKLIILQPRHLRPPASAIKPANPGPIWPVPVWSHSGKSQV